MVNAETPGFERGRKLEKIGLRTQDLAELAFTSMAVPVENRLGEENQAFHYLTNNLAQERLSIAIAGIALATQGVLSNVVAGLTIIFTKPYRVGEYISIVGIEGRVEAITLFNTTLTHVDRSQVIVPNRKVVGEILHNYGQIRQSEVQVQVAYDSNLPLVLETLRTLAAANARVLADPAPVIQIEALGDSAVRVALRPWVAVVDYAAVAGELYLSLLSALRERGIANAYPQREVRLIGADQG